MAGPSTLGDKGWGEDLWFCAQVVEGDWAPKAGYDGLKDGEFDAGRQNAAWGREGA